MPTRPVLPVICWTLSPWKLPRSAPEDARVLARYQLRQLQDQLTQVIRRHGRTMDTTSLAHLEAVSDRINQVLGARLETF